ncbi:MAG: CBS domain-containing protein [Myxococcota bacterium]
MRVEDLMNKDVRACKADDSMNEAARVMWEIDCGFVPVVAADGSGRVVGVITDRDVCMASYTRGVSLHELRVSEAMSASVRACSPGDSLSSAEAEMGAGRVRRLPVVDAAGQLLGILSLADIARRLATSRAHGRKEITASEVGDLLAAVCQPRQIAGPAS